MAKFKPGELWQVDIGLAAKIHPCLILSDYPKDNELPLVVVVPHTTGLLGNRWEVSIPKTFFKARSISLTANTRYVHVSKQRYTTKSLINNPKP